MNEFYKKLNCMQVKEWDGAMQELLQNPYIRKLTFFNITNSTTPYVIRLLVALRTKLKALSLLSITDLSGKNIRDLVREVRRLQNLDSLSLSVSGFLHIASTYTAPLSAPHVAIEPRDGIEMAALSRCRTVSVSLGAQTNVLAKIPTFFPGAPLLMRLREAYVCQDDIAGHVDEVCRALARFEALTALSLRGCKASHILRCMTEHGVPVSTVELDLSDTSDLEASAKELGKMRLHKLIVRTPAPVGSLAKLVDVVQQPALTELSLCANNSRSSATALLEAIGKTRIEAVRLAVDKYTAAAPMFVADFCEKLSESGTVSDFSLLGLGGSKGYERMEEIVNLLVNLRESQCVYSFESFAFADFVFMSGNYNYSAISPENLRRIWTAIAADPFFSSFASQGGVLRVFDARFDAAAPNPFA